MSEIYESIEKTIEVKMNGGTLKTYESTDPNYPGIWIGFEKDGIEHNVALVEFHPEQGLRTVSWTKGEEEYVGCTVWDENLKPNTKGDK